ncbi:LacI family DNA-binding transcriptional regulator [Roseibium sp. M-1]
MKKRVTLKDVAHAAGVHTSTVSRALDHNASALVAREVSDRIKKLAKEMGYRPNRMAAGLRTSRSMSVGIMIPDITNMLFAPIVRGISSALEPAGYSSILVNTDNIPDQEKKMIEVLIERGVDGIINGATYRDEPEIEELLESGPPFVTLNRRIEKSPYPYVISDDEFGIQQVVAHLHDLGHRRICHLAGPQNLSTGKIRLETFVAQCHLHGLEHSADTYAIASAYNESEGERCVSQLLSSSPSFTAIVCANDRLALGAYTEIRRRGLVVPDDISVTGYNDHAILEMIPPRLTTVRVPKFDAGRVCGEVMLRLMKGESLGAVGTILPVKLIVRDSTCPPKT